MMYHCYAGIRVTNLERSLSFYTGLLGLEEVSRGDAAPRGYGGGTWVHLMDKISRQRLELNWYPPGSPFAAAYVPGEGLDHLGFFVDDVEQTYNDLVAKGAQPTELTPEKSDGWFAYVKDPDGNWIELLQPTEPKRAVLKRTAEAK
jgi:lactoylglutathione lyase